MNELAANSSPLLHYGIVALIILVAFIVWFFVNRASVRASEHLQLLKMLVEEQKKQTALLRRIAEAQGETSSAVQDDEGTASRDFIRLIPER